MRVLRLLRLSSSILTHVYFWQMNARSYSCYLSDSQMKRSLDCFEYQGRNLKPG